MTPPIERHASIRIQRRIDWIDTDASGIYHYSTFCRLADSAESLLFDRLDMSEAFVRLPRLAVEARFKMMLRFNDVVTVEYRVSHLGNSSIRFDFTISRDGALAVEGKVTALLFGHDLVKKPWPPEYRERLLTAGQQIGEILAESPVKSRAAVEGTR